MVFNHELEMSKWNSKAIHALFYVVLINQMKAIGNGEIVKDAWQKLKIKNEETESVYKTTLGRVITDFENLTMLDSEIKFDFHAKLCNISKSTMYVVCGIKIIQKQ